MLQFGNEDRACRDARLASFSYDNGRKLSPDLQAQGPTSRHTSHLYIALGGRIAGKCVDPCRLQLGTHQGEEMEDYLLQPQCEPMGRRTQAYSHWLWPFSQGGPLQEEQIYGFVGSDTGCGAGAEGAVGAVPG